MKISYLLNCEAASITQENKVVIHAVFDTLFVEGDPSAEKPAVFPSMTFVFEIEEVDRTQEINIALKLKSAASGTVVFAKTSKAVPVAKDAPKKLGGIIAAPLLRFPNIGEYVIELEVDGEVIAKRSISVQAKKV